MSAGATKACVSSSISSRERFASNSCCCSLLDLVLRRFQLVLDLLLLLLRARAPATCRHVARFRAAARAAIAADRVSCIPSSELGRSCCAAGASSGLARSRGLR